MADNDGMEEVDSGTELDPPTAHFGSLSGHYPHLHVGLRKTNSDPAKAPLPNNQAANRSPSLVQSIGRTHSSKDTDGSSQMEVMDNPPSEDMEDVTDSKRPVTQTVSGSSTSSLVSQFGGMNMLPNQVTYPMMVPAFPPHEQSQEQIKKQMELMQMAQLQLQLQAQAQAQMMPMLQQNVMPMMPGGLLLQGLPLMPQATNPIASISSATPTSVPLSTARKPTVSQTLSLPGVPPQLGHQFEQLMKEYHMAQEKISAERKKIEVNFKERQQALLQHQMIEKQQFQEQLRVLMFQHNQWQQQLEQQSQNLTKLQQQTLTQMQKQQEEIYLEQLKLQSQHQQITAMQQKKPVTRILQPSPVQSHSDVALQKSTDSSSRTDLPSSAAILRMPSSDQPPLAEPKPSLSRTASHHSGHASLDIRYSVGSESSSISGSIGGDQSNYLGGGDSTGIVYESTMLRHNCSCAQAHQAHPEHSGRMQSIWSRLHERKIVDRCSRIRARKANQQELLTVHSQQLVQLYGKSSSKKGPNERKDLPAGAFTKLACGGIGIDTDTYWNEQTPQAAKTAAGCVIQLADDVASGKIKNGFAIVRPPGHHAMKSKSMGFCYFNNVALAAKSMLAKSSIKKVMIVDWDIHHGNGTQQVFYDTSDVLFVSIHRYDNGHFFPGSGVPDEIGTGAGTGFNVNIAFSGPCLQSGFCSSSCGDPEYLAAFRSVVIPLAYEYKPDVILVSAGFNATDGHPPTLGGYTVSPQCFGHLTRLLMGVCNGRVILALEGGYELRSLCASAEACMLALLGDELLPIDDASIKAQPNAAAVESIKQTISKLLPYWSKLRLSQNLLPISHWQAHCGMSELAAMTSLTATK